MAKVNLNPVFQGFSNRIGDLVFIHSRGKTYARKKTVPRQANSEAQLRVRALFKEIIDAWKSLSGDERQSWDGMARHKDMSGYNLFMKVNMKRRQADEVILRKCGGEDI